MSTQRPRILIIDDDPLYRSLMTTLLRKDYLLAVAADGAEGYQKALQHPPDIAIIDIQMPGWDGLKTLDEFRKNPILKRVKIVMLTGDASKESVVAAIRGGANDYVIKTSFSREEFREKLRRLSSKQIAPVAVTSNSPIAQPAQQQNSKVNIEQNSKIQHIDAPESSSPAPASANTQIPKNDPVKVVSESDNDTNADLQTMIDDWE
jgi:CheY-like chemotaxis protein